MGEGVVEKIFTLKEVCERFRREIGKTRLTRHIKKVPIFAGAPTHRRLPGGKYLFTERDIERLIDSLAPPAKAEPSTIFPSEKAAFQRLNRLLNTDQAYANAVRKNNKARR